MCYTTHGFNIEMSYYRYKRDMSFGSFLVNTIYCVDDNGRQGEGGPKDLKSGNQMLK